MGSRVEVPKGAKLRALRPYLIDIEDFETVEEIEMEDWMFGSSGGHLV